MATLSDSLLIFTVTGSRCLFTLRKNKQRVKILIFRHLRFHEIFVFIVHFEKKRIAADMLKNFIEIPIEKADGLTFDVVQACGDWLKLNATSKILSTHFAYISQVVVRRLFNTLRPENHSKSTQGSRPLFLKLKA